jgi:quinol monooxygenase YgiN
MIQACLRIVPPADKRLELRTVMRALTGPTEVAKGCCDCRVLQDTEDDGGLTYLVQFESMNQMKTHLRSQRFRRLLPYIELSVRPPEFEMYSLKRIGEIESLIAVLGSRSKDSQSVIDPHQ